MIDKTSWCLKLRKSRSTSRSSEVNLRSGQYVYSEMIVSDSMGESLGEDADTGSVAKSRLALVEACRDHNHDGKFCARDFCDVSVNDVNDNWRNNEDLCDDLCEKSQASVNIENLHDDSNDINQSSEQKDAYSSVCERTNCCTFQISTAAGFGQDILKPREQCSCECQATRSFQLTHDSGKADENKHLNADDRLIIVKSRRNSGRRTHSKSSRSDVTTEDTYSSHCSKFNICKALSSWIHKNMAMLVCCQCLIVLVLCVGGVFMGMNYSGDKSKTATLLMKPGSKEPLIYDYPSEGEFDYVISDRDRADYPHQHQATRVILDKPFRSVSVSDFQSHLSRSKSVADMLKIFFDDPNLTEEQVRQIMFMKSHQGLYASNGETSSRRGHMMSDLGSNNMDEAFKHYREVEASPAAGCEPKPEVERMDDHQHELGPRTFLPSCTIVHRCRNTTSCCPKGFECVPKKENGIQIIDRYFMVLEAVPGSDRMKPASKDFIYAKSYQNHTACECVKVEFTSNCAKFCPHSFKKERPGRDCICDCRHQHRKCQKIMHGQQALDEEDLVCIKEGKCIVPECYAGEFNVANGFCPFSTRRKRDRDRL
ncbi:uncharacterized protein LOC127875882 [Dreissena polymorpha]|uniref:Platelet-derived growth factor (PDGF) family profile domain-containing protein n=1 Tax=Dreissena polymorpha TaxID=45954 RepID=A0A9D4KL30_DREPO|nr:uncharacterized protein LOC127875882 [Dreissena polymorpha]KAH3841895.1 hypothetical protein DPMN_115377 [Dreissena polymorpha]